MRDSDGAEMVANRGAFVLLLLLVALLFPADDASRAVDRLQRGFEQPPDDARIMVRWWWFGPAVTEAQLEREMRLMKEGGIGGFSAATSTPCGTLNSSTMMVMMIASTPSLNASSRFLSRPRCWPEGRWPRNDDVHNSELRLRPQRLSGVRSA